MSGSHAQPMTNQRSHQKPKPLSPNVELTGRAEMPQTLILTDF